VSLEVWEPKAVELADVAAQARAYVAASRSENTTRAYRADWGHFTAWCDGRRLPSLPADPTTVALYATDMADTFKPSTISRRLVSIAQAHKAAGHLTPTTDERVRLVNAGIRRVHGVAPRQVRPVVTADLRRMVGTGPIWKRGGFNRSTQQPRRTPRMVTHRRGFVEDGR
jgi:hypothetical protein